MKFRLVMSVLLISAAVAADYTKADYANMDIVDNISYIQDHRVNLCYAKYLAVNSRYSYGGITLVPCENVKPLLVNP